VQKIYVEFLARTKQDYCHKLVYTYIFLSKEKFTFCKEFLIF